MGAWGTGIFDNDDAMDWVMRLDEDGREAVDEAIDAVLETAPEYLERDVGAGALAAAEVVAALRGRPSTHLPPEVASWLAAHPDLTVTSELVLKARRALDHATNPGTSEVAELWADAPRGTEWRALTEDLRARLA